MRVLVLMLLLGLGLAEAAFAHETTRSYVAISRDGSDMTVDVQIAFRDIEVAVWLDENLDSQITWGETSRRIEAVSDYMTAALTFEANGPCKLIRVEHGTSQNAGIDYLDLSFDGICPDPDPNSVPGAGLRVTSRLFAEFDPDHRVFLTANIGGSSTTSLLGGGDTSILLSGTNIGPAEIFSTYFKEGVRHLLEGADHLVFLLLLILPAAFAQTSLPQAAAGVLIAVTGFTLAHALTLTAAATAILRPPSLFIEVLIAVSIVITAIDNLRPFIPAPRAAVAAFFGLIHGFGFATALGALPLSGSSFATALIGFNLGIEAAQFGLVVLILPAFYVLRKHRLFLQVGSLGGIVVGLFWVWDRLAT